MTVIKVNTVEECLDGTTVFEIVFGEPVNGDAIRSLDSLGTLEYFSDFPRPFYRVEGEAFQLKGVEGNDRCRVWVGYVKDPKKIVDRIVEQMGTR